MQTVQTSYLCRSPYHNPNSPCRSPCRSPCTSPCRTEVIVHECPKKDMIIRTLKSRVYDLERNEKDYSLLNDRYNRLQTDLCLLTQTKNSLECEMKQKEELHNKQYYDLIGENEDLQNEKKRNIILNNKLSAENECLGHQLCQRNQDINELQRRLSETNNQLSKTIVDKNGLEQRVSDLTDIKVSQVNEINKLLADNQKLTHVIQNQDCNIKHGEEERIMLNQKINENNHSIANLRNQNSSQNDQINSLKGQLNNANLNIKRLEAKIKDLERINNTIQRDNDNLKLELLNEKGLKNDKDKQNDLLNEKLNGKNKDLMNLQRDLDNLKKLHMSVTEEKSGCELENNKLRDHIMYLTSQNQKLANELEIINEEDDRLRSLLARRDRIELLLKDNKTGLELKLAELDEFMKKNKATKYKSRIEIKESYETKTIPVQSKVQVEEHVEQEENVEEAEEEVQE